MKENQNDIKYYDDEIDLRELIMALWKRKKMIIAFTLIVAILAASFSMFILSPVYETNLNIIISMPETYNTRYGEYKLPITSNEQYINLIYSNDVLINTIKDMGYNTEEITISKLSKRINVTKSEPKANTVQNIFTVTVSADNPEESLKLAQSLYNNYAEFMDVMVKERTINHYIGYFSVETRSLENRLVLEKETLAKNEYLLSQTPKTIDAKSNVEIQSPLTSESDYIIPVETANPNYINIENDIINNKQSINYIESTINQYTQYLEELGVEKEAVGKYYDTGRTEKLMTSVIGIVENNIYLASPPVAPTQKTSPSNALNTVIGAVLGGMIGVMTALVVEYWFKKESN
jgi:capsular polysaccharide biosynthesis protein